ncbi:MAG: hypothetical protein H0U20_03270 [Thermoleophilaceae bacterium]|nr:hypothetical protein [Thermoleophilaceae bacterium]
MLASLLTLAVAVSAWAVGSASNTDSSVNYTTSTRDAGTKAKPKATTLSLVLRAKTKNGNGQPATSTSLNVLLPKGFIQNSKIWPKSKRCDINKVNAQGDDSVCPTGSKVGTGKSIAKGGADESKPSGPNNGITETIVVTAHVIKNGNIGFFLDGKPVTIRPSMIQGKVDGRKLNVIIPPTVQEPVPGVATGIELLTTKFNGTTRIKGKRVGILATTGCFNKRWKLSFTNVFRGGARDTNSDTVRCTK